MAAPRLLPDRTTLERLRRQHKTYGEIAELYGVTESAVHARLKHEGLTDTTRASHAELIPWTVKKEHQHTFPILMLRTLSRRNQGLGNTAERDRMLDRWLAELQEQRAVVCYDPEMWPNPASPKHGGWFYTKRRATDGDSIIRYVKPGKGLPRKPK